MNDRRYRLPAVLLAVALLAGVADAQDQRAPSIPSGLMVSSTLATSVTLSWAPSRGGASGYDVYNGSVRVAATTSSPYTFTNLDCGTTYTFAVDAFDGHGNKSVTASLAASTSPCSVPPPPPPPPPGDTQPPMTPTNLYVSTADASSLGLAWHPSSDNVGVVGYDLFNKGVKVGSTPGTTYTFSSLSCGSSTILGVAAYDAAGNHSPIATAAGATNPCLSTAPSTSATVFISPDGSDANPCTQIAPCATFDRGRKVAAPGGAISVSGGTYSANWVAAGAATIYPDAAHDSTGAAPVTFVCQGNGDVTFDATAPNFAFYPGVANVSFTGGCFRFHIPHFGYGGYPAVTRNIVLDGVHMDSFECSGCANLTIRNSEIGPSVGCYGPSQNKGAGTCDPSAPAQAYWAQLSQGSSNQQYTPYIHRNTATPASSVTLESDYFHDVQTGDAAAMHTECLLVWGVEGLVVRGTRFYRCAIFDLLVLGDDVANNLDIENNFFSAPVQPLDNPTPGVETPKDWRDFAVKSFSSTTLGNWLIRFNSFEHGISLDNSQVGQAYSNARVIGNILGSYSYCVPGVTFDYNATVNNGIGCDSHVVNMAAFPYASYAGGDLHLKAGVNAIDAVSSIAADDAIATDLDGQRRPMGTARDVGADESA